MVVAAVREEERIPAEAVQVNEDVLVIWPVWMQVSEASKVYSSAGTLDDRSSRHWYAKLDPCHHPTFLNSLLVAIHHHARNNCLQERSCPFANHSCIGNPWSPAQSLYPHRPHSHEGTRTTMNLPEVNEEEEACASLVSCCQERMGIWSEV